MIWSIRSRGLAATAVVGGVVSLGLGLGAWVRTGQPGDSEQHRSCCIGRWPSVGTTRLSDGHVPSTVVDFGPNEL